MQDNIYTYNKVNKVYNDISTHLADGHVVWHGRGGGQQLTQGLALGGKGVCVYVCMCECM